MSGDVPRLRVPQTAETALSAGQPHEAIRLTVAAELRRLARHGSAVDDQMLLDRADALDAQRRRRTRRMRFDPPGSGEWVYGIRWPDGRTHTHDLSGALAVSRSYPGRCRLLRARRGPWESTTWPPPATPTSAEEATPDEQ